MKGVLILFCLVSSVTCVKEDEPPAIGVDALSQLLNDSSISELLNDPNLWMVLKKRLEDMDSDGCSSTNRRTNTIIKTKDSLDAGALFIASPSVRTQTQCRLECCAESSCTTAIVKDQGAQSEYIACYLFNCLQPSVCVFASHSFFTVLDFSNRLTLDRHVEDLYKLGSSSSAAATSTAVTITTTMPTKMNTPTKVVAQSGKTTTKLVGLFTECRHTTDCRDENTDCLAGYCICRRGYHIIDMHCRRDCNQELEFECVNKDSPLVSECIAVYDFCDGTTQCSDGSDEISCTKHDGIPDTNTMEKKLHTTSMPSLNLASSRVAASLAAVDDNHDNPTKFAPTTVEFNRPPTNVAVGHDDADIPDVEVKHETLEQDANAASKEEADTEVEGKYFWKLEKNRAAVVALVLGVVLTTALLIFAGCRLRRFHKRYRKGRHFNSNEADYLINGMYL